VEKGWRRVMFVHFQVKNDFLRRKRMGANRSSVLAYAYFVKKALGGYLL
jgi:hypothetical protein